MEQIKIEIKDITEELITKIGAKVWHKGTMYRAYLELDTEDFGYDVTAYGHDTEETLKMGLTPISKSKYASSGLNDKIKLTKIYFDFNTCKWGWKSEFSDEKIEKIIEKKMIELNNWNF